MTVKTTSIKQERRSLPLPVESWQRLDKLAEETDSTAKGGQHYGQPTWRNLWRRIADSPDLLELIKHQLNSSHLDYSNLPHVVVVRPESPKTNTIAWLYLQGETVSINFPEKRDDFREVVKSLGCTWDRPYWQRKINKLAGKPADRAAELGHYLLASGFCVVFPSADIRDMAIAGLYEPEQKRWVLVRTAGDYKHWFALKWRYSEDCYAEAMKLSGARYSNPCAIVPPENYEEVEDFAQIHGFKFSDAALEILGQVKKWRESAMVVSLDEIKAGDKPQFERPDLEMPEGVEIDDELADDFDLA